MKKWRVSYLLVPALVFGTPQGALGQIPRLPNPFGVSGQISTTGELYRANGTDSRRPGQVGRVSLNQQVTLFGSFSVGLDMLFSTEGSQVRQNIGQFGVNPTWRWATLHLGDFSRDISSYTVQGSRLRGAGVDLRPGVVRLSLQGGRSQRTVAAGSGNLAFRRNLYAATLGVGSESSSFLDVQVLTAKDDPSSLDFALQDTLLLDTIPDAVRPRYDARPQQNLVVGTQGRLSLLDRRLTLSGEAAMAVITRDVESPSVDPSSVTAGGTLDGAIPLTLSSSGDYAFKVEGAFNARPGSIKAGYEYVGAGYTSLGLAYVINDRQGYNVGGNLRLLANRLTFQGQLQHQNDNLLSQKASTTNRDALMGSLALLVSRNVTTALTAMTNVLSNDAVVDTFVVDNRSLALTANTAVQGTLGGRKSTLSIAYAFQRSSDANVVTRIPEVTVHNVSASVQVALTPAVSVAPTFSLAATSTEGAEGNRSANLGFRGQGRFGDLRPTASVTRTFANGRAVSVMMAQMVYALPWETQLSLQARHSRYDAIGTRPAFQESFATMSVSRSFR